MQSMNPNKIIDALGGTVKVAVICRIKPPSVSFWRINGIPEARLMYLRLLKPKIFAALEKEEINDSAITA